MFYIKYGYLDKMPMNHFGLSWSASDFIIHSVSGEIIIKNVRVCLKGGGG